MTELGGNIVSILELYKIFFSSICVHVRDIVIVIERGPNLHSKSTFV